MLYYAGTLFLCTPCIRLSLIIFVKITPVPLVGTGVI